MGIKCCPTHVDGIDICQLIVAEIKTLAGLLNSTVGTIDAGRHHFFTENSSYVGTHAYTRSAV